MNCRASIATYLLAAFMAKAESSIATQPTYEKRKIAGKRQTHALVTVYLLVYNIVSAVAWTGVFYLVAKQAIDHASRFKHSNPTFLAAFDSLRRTYRSSFQLNKQVLPLGVFIRAVETASVLEILHAVLGWTQSSVSGTIIQVAGRCYVIWVLVEGSLTVRKMHDQESSRD